MVLLSFRYIIIEDDHQPDETVDDFDATIRTCIASHATPEDRHELVQQLRSPRKPRDIGQIILLSLTRNQRIRWLSLRPIGLLVAKRIQNQKCDWPLKTLFDPGSDKTFINQSSRTSSRSGATGKTVKSIGVNTINGVNKFNQKVILEELVLPEFSATRKIDQKVSAYIFDQESSPYMISSLVLIC
jgi:hypothetical protein